MLQDRLFHGILLSAIPAVQGIPDGALPINPAAEGAMEAAEESFESFPIKIRPI